MSLQFAPEPKNASTIIRAGLNRLAAGTSPLGVIDFATVQIKQPHAVYDLGQTRSRTGAV